MPCVRTYRAHVKPLAEMTSLIHIYLLHWDVMTSSKSVQADMSLYVGIRYSMAGGPNGPPTCISYTTL